MKRILIDVDTQFDFVDPAGSLYVDAAVEGLLERGYEVRVRGNATAAIGGEAGQARSRAALEAAGAQWLARDPEVA